MDLSTATAIERGFEVFKDVLSAVEWDSLADKIRGDCQARGRAGVRNLMGNLAVRNIANDRRLTEIVERFVGRPAVPYRATLFEKSAQANWLVVWHQDTALPVERRFDSPEWGPWSTKAGIKYARAPHWVLEKAIALRVHLDDSTDSNGPLRVIPGSHKFGVLPESEVVELGNERDSFECVCPKGGVIAMRPLLIHGSSKAVDANARRVLHIEYIDSLDLADNIRIAIA